jgi:hypothetical protein
MSLLKGSYQQLAFGRQGLSSNPYSTQTSKENQEGTSSARMLGCMLMMSTRSLQRLVAHFPGRTHNKQPSQTEAP